MNTSSRIKIIHILCHTIPLKKDYIFDGWPARLATYIQKYSSNYDQECYYAVTGIKKKLVLKKNGVSHKLFPARTLHKGLESFFGIIFCPDLFLHLKKEIEFNKIIVHIQGERGSIVLQTIHTAKNTPIFIQFHGYSVPKILSLFERLFITPLERHYFKLVKHFFVSIKDRVNYLVKFCHVNNSKISLQNLGVDYDIFKPHDQMNARKRLRLPLTKTIFLYVGHFDVTKGAKKIIDAHNALKNKYNTYLVLIGGMKSDIFYRYAKQNADLVVGRIKHTDLVPYFNAADAYCLLCPPAKADFAGMGIAPTEALACDKPILSSSLGEAPLEIQDKIGLSVRNEIELMNAMIYIIKNKNRFNNIRSLTKKYFSWKENIENILVQYQKI